jgi:hypothetical protein
MGGSMADKAWKQRERDVAEFFGSDAFSKITHQMMRNNMNLTLFEEKRNFAQWENIYQPYLPIGCFL